MEVLGKLFLSTEEFRGRVRRAHIAEEILAVSHKIYQDPLDSLSGAPVGRQGRQIIVWV